MSDPILSIRGLRKAYASGVEALKSVDLDIRRGEIFALLGPNGAGKTTLINIVCGIVTPSGGQVLVDGKDHLTDYRHARSRIGLVPQELTTDAFESVLSTVSFSRGLFGKARDPAKIEDLLRRLSLWDKRKARMMVVPSERSLRTSSHMSRRSSTSTPAVGSSRNNMSGSWLSALAIMTRRFMPPESVMILLLRLSQSDSSRSTFST